MRARHWTAVAFLASVLVPGCEADPGTQSDPGTDSLLEPGQELYWEGRYDSARVVWGTSLDRARAEGDSAARADLLTWMGLAAMRVGDYGTARSEGEAALELKLALNREERLARSYNALGLLALSEDRLLDALRLFDRTREAAEAVDDDRMAAAASGNAGLIHAYLGDLERARGLLREMREGAVAVGDSLLQANALTNLAMVAVWSGDPAAALEPLEEARRLYERFEYPLGTQYALGQLATAYSDMGRYREALAAMDTALALAQRHQMQDQEAENHRIMGSILATLGDHRRALRHYDQAGALARELDLQSELGNISRAAARSQLALGMNDSALRAARRAQEAHRAAGEPFEQLDDLLVMARIQQRLGRTVEAEESLTSARIIARELDAPSARTAVALAEARHAEDLHRPEQVLAAVERALNAASRADAAAATVAHGLAARAHAELGRIDSAAARGLVAVRALDRVRGDLGSAELRGSMTAASAGLYGDVVIILLRAGRTDEAFRVADGARSRELVRRLTMVGTAEADSPSSRNSAGPRDDLAAAELLLRRIDALLAELRALEGTPSEERGAGAAVTSREIRSRLATLRDRYESLTIRAASGRAAAILTGRDASETEVRAALAPDEAILHYTLTENQLVLFVGRRDRLQTVRVSVAADDLASRVRLLRSLWGTRRDDRRLGLPAAQALHDLLIRPAVETGLLEDATRLLIVPHGVLEQLPFAALHDATTDRFLVEDYIIAHAPSAGAVPALRAPALQRGKKRASMIFAPFPQDLPGTRREASAAGEALSGSRLRLAHEATERVARRALAESGVVHIASHGVLNARNPMFSRIRLARGPGATSADDGRLEAHEVLELPVRSRLVVLSGCETALAEAWTGDPLQPVGLATLAQAFLQAGAANVVATLWRIHDVGSAELVSRFYREMDDGDPAGALARAQRDMIRHTELSAPYYWAGFVLAGRSEAAGGSVSDE